ASGGLWRHNPAVNGAGRAEDQLRAQRVAIEQRGDFLQNSLPARIKQVDAYVQPAPRGQRSEEFENSLARHFADGIFVPATGGAERFPGLQRDAGDAARKFPDVAPRDLKGQFAFADTRRTDKRQVMRNWPHFSALALHGCFEKSRQLLNFSLAPDK